MNVNRLIRVSIVLHCSANINNCFIISQITCAHYQFNSVQLWVSGLDCLVFGTKLLREDEKESRQQIENTQRDKDMTRIASHTRSLFSSSFFTYLSFSIQSYTCHPPIIICLLNQWVLLFFVIKKLSKMHKHPKTWSKTANEELSK